MKTIIQESDFIGQFPKLVDKGLKSFGKVTKVVGNKTLGILNKRPNCNETKHYNLIFNFTAPFFEHLIYKLKTRRHLLYGI